MVGVFVVGVVVLVVAVILLFGSGDTFAEKDYFTVYFPGSVNGLNVGAPVKFRGVTMGAVTGIRAFHDDKAEFYVRVDFELLKDQVENPTGFMANAPDEEWFQFLLDRGMSAQLNSQSMLTGQLYVMIDFFPDQHGELLDLETEFPQIPSVPTASEIMMADIREALKSIAAFPVEELAAQVDDLLIRMNEILDSTEFGSTLSGIDSLIASTNALVREVEKQLGPTSQTVRETAESAAGTLGDAEKLLTRMDNFVSANETEMDAAIKDLSAAARSLRALADYLERNPEAVVFGKKD
jgi:paraquat-inducible protein B